MAFTMSVERSINSVRNRRNRVPDYICRDSRTVAVANRSEPPLGRLAPLTILRILTFNYCLYLNFMTTHLNQVISISK
jgi:hypothetical protein